jgi:hypothetical protein
MVMFQKVPNAARYIVAIFATWHPGKAMSIAARSNLDPFGEDLA